MTFKTVSQLKEEIKAEAESKSLDSIREEVELTIKENIMFGEYQIDYYAPIGVNKEYIEKVCSELNECGYKAQVRTGSENKYVLLAIECA